MASNATPAVTFTDCIISGSGDVFQLNSGASITGTNNAIVTAGPNAVADPTNLPTTNQINQDPIYAPAVFTITIGATNPNLLLPTNCFYDGQATGPADLIGGATGGTITPCPSEVDHWTHF